MKVVFAGGGTGGHLMAGLSIAQEISSRFPGTRIIFFGTNKKKRVRIHRERAVMSLNKLWHVS